MDTLFIQALQAETYIGVYDWEQQKKQTVELDLELAVDISAINDAADHYVDYAAVCEAVTTFISEKRFRLIETLAQDVAALILQQFTVKKVKLSVHKVGIIDNVKKVGLTIERMRRNG